MDNEIKRQKLKNPKKIREPKIGLKKTGENRFSGGEKKIKKKKKNKKKNKTHLGFPSGPNAKAASPTMVSLKRTKNTHTTR